MRAGLRTDVDIGDLTLRFCLEPTTRAAQLNYPAMGEVMKK